MRLRQKIFAVVLASMGILFLLVALSISLDALSAGAERRRLEERLLCAAAEVFVHAAEGGDLENVRRRLSALGLELWEVRDEKGAVVAAGPRARARGGTGGRPSVPLREAARAGGLTLLLPPAGPAVEPITWLFGPIWAVAAGTVFLLLVLYGLLLRLVLRPVERLAAASKVLSAGARPPKIPGEGRTDELGELVRTFNSMAQEVTSAREELQSRLQEAKDSFERAQKRLVMEQRLASTGRLAAGIAHEINNPLAGLLNAVRTVRKEGSNLSEKAAEYLAMTEEGLVRIATIVQDMLRYSPGRTQVRSVDLQECIRGAIDLARHRIEKEGVELATDLGDGPVQVSGDGGALGQVFLNLLLNALDAVVGSPERCIRVRLLRERDEVLIEIADTGRGMSEEELASAFDLFYSGKETGTGLGLAIAHKIVTDHGGSIELACSPGRGTKALIRLPAEEAK